MAKRTFAFVAVFAALLSVTLSVQAQDTPDDPPTYDNSHLYWTDGANQSTPLFYTGANWQDQNGIVCPTTFIDGHNTSTAPGNELWIQNCYISDSNNKAIKMDWGNMGVLSLTLGDGTGDHTATMERRDGSNNFTYLDVKTNLTIQTGGSLTTGSLNITNLNSTTNGAVTVSGGLLKSNTSIAINNGSLSLTGGTLQANSLTIGSNGTFTHSGGTLTTNGSGLAITGDYTLGSSATLKPNGTITVSGTVALNGTIDTSTYTASTPSAGTSYTLVSANSITMPSAKQTAIGDSLPQTWVTTLSSTALKTTYDNGAGSFYWKDVSGGDNNMYTAKNWVYGSDQTSNDVVLGTYIGPTDHNVSNYTRNCYVYSTSNATSTNGAKIDWSDLGIASLTVGDGTGTRTAKMYSARGPQGFDLLTTLTVNKGGTVSMTYGTPTYITGGTLNVSGGTYNADAVIRINGGGILNLSSGTINVSSAGITNTSGAYTINLSGGTFGTNSASWTSALTANIASGTAVTFAPASGKAITWSGALTGSGGVTVDGAGTLTLSGNNTYSGGTTITAGTLKLADGGTLGSGNVTNNANLEIATDAGRDFSTVISGTGSLTKTGTGVLRYSGAGTYSGGTNISGGAIRLDPNGSLGSGTINIAAGADLRFAGNLNGITISNTITGAGGLTKQGTGNTVTLSGDLSGFTGTLTTNGENGQTGSTIKLTGANTNLVNASAVVDNGTLDVSGYTGTTTMQLNKLSGAGNVKTGSNAIILNNAANADTTFSGVINGSGSVTKTGAGTLELTGANDYSGVTTISTGTLKLSGSGALGTGSIVDNATLEFAHTGTQSFSNVISGTGAVTKTGSGTVTLSGANTYSGGTTISAGALVLSENGTLGAGDVENNAVLEFAHSSNMDFSNVISGTGAVNKTGSGKLTLSGANTYTGMTTVSGGVLELTGDAVVANGPVSVGANGTLEYEVGKDGNNQPITKKLSISEINKIVSTGTVKKTGDGTLQLYSAAQGLIDVESLTVSSGRVDLKGYMTGGITVDAGGVFSPGNSVGEATFGGGYILKEGATLLIEQDGSGIDKLNVGSFTFDETSVSKGIELDITGIPFGSQYDIITSSTDFTGDMLSDEYWLKHFKNDIPDYMTLVVVNNNTVRLSIDRNQVPEPSTWALLILGAAGLLYWRKRKNA